MTPKPPARARGGRMSIRRCKFCELDTIAEDWRHNRCPNCGEMVEPTPDPRETTIAALQQQVRELTAEIESRDNQENACLREARDLAGRRDLHSSFDGYRWIRERIEALTRERDGALKAIDHYGKHLHSCCRYQSFSSEPCNCGLDAARFGEGKS